MSFDILQRRPDPLRVKVVDGGGVEEQQGCRGQAIVVSNPTSRRLGIAYFRLTRNQTSSPCVEIIPPGGERTIGCDLSEMAVVRAIQPLPDISSIHRGGVQTPESQRQAERRLGLRPSL